MKDKDDIARLLLEKMPEIDKQLEKLKDFEDNLKNIIIPVLNFYLNYNQLDVTSTSYRPKNKQGNNWEISPINSTTRTEETSSSNTSSRWPTTTITKTTA